MASKFPIPESFPVTKSDEEWKAELSAEDYRVIRKKVSRYSGLCWVVPMLSQAMDRSLGRKSPFKQGDDTRTVVLYIIAILSLFQSGMCSLYA